MRQRFLERLWSCDETLATKYSKIDWWCVHMGQVTLPVQLPSDRAGFVWFKWLWCHFAPWLRAFSICRKVLKRPHKYYILLCFDLYERMGELHLIISRRRGEWIWGGASNFTLPCNFAVADTRECLARVINDLTGLTSPAVSLSLSLLTTASSSFLPQVLTTTSSSPC